METCSYAEKAELFQKVGAILNPNDESVFYTAVTKLFDHLGSPIVNMEPFEILNFILEQKKSIGALKSLLKAWDPAFQDILSRRGDQEKAAILTHVVKMYEESLEIPGKIGYPTLLQFFLFKLDPIGDQTVRQLSSEENVKALGARVIKDRKKISTLLDLPCSGSLLSDMRTRLWENHNYNPSLRGSVSDAKIDLIKDTFTLMIKKRRSSEEERFLEQAFEALVDDLTSFFIAKIGQLKGEALYDYSVLDQGMEPTPKHFKEYFEPIAQRLQSLCNLFLDFMDQDIQEPKNREAFSSALIQFIKELCKKGNFLCAYYLCENFLNIAFLSEKEIHVLPRGLQSFCSDMMTDKRGTELKYWRFEKEWEMERQGDTAAFAIPFYVAQISQAQKQQGRPVLSRMMLMEQLASRIEQCSLEEENNRQSQKGFKTTIIEDLERRMEQEARGNPQGDPVLSEIEQTPSLPRRKKNGAGRLLQRSFGSFRNSLRRKKPPT